MLSSQCVATKDHVTRGAGPRRAQVGEDSYYEFEEPNGLQVDLSWDHARIERLSGLQHLSPNHSLGFRLVIAVTISWYGPTKFLKRAIKRDVVGRKWLYGHFSYSGVV
jgi:hypothetical protein